MADPTQYSFDLQEVASILVREQGITEGRWILGFELNMTIGTFGANQAAARPGAMMQIAGLNLSKAPTDVSSDTPFVVDAANVAQSVSAGSKLPKGRKR